MQRVLVLGTGGTIASVDGTHGLEPNQESTVVRQALKGYEALFEIDYEPILNLDSSNIQMEEWLVMAKRMYAALPDYDGIIVLHGTDTMAYSASMQSYLLQGLDKPIVFTGSQIPMAKPLSDAPANLSLAFEAVRIGLFGVTIAFHGKVIQATRAVKVKTRSLAAFQSINAPYRAELFSDGLHPAPYVRPASAPSALRLYEEVCNDVFLLKLIPGTNPQIFTELRHLRYRGLVIETFGSGGMHDIRRDLLQPLKELIAAGIVVAVCSQCLYEASDLSIYEVGKKLQGTGVISTGDMTTEAVVTKMMWALGQSRDPDDIAAMFARNYAGELGGAL